MIIQNYILILAAALALAYVSGVVRKKRPVPGR